MPINFQQKKEAMGMSPYQCPTNFFTEMKPPRGDPWQC